MIDQLMFRCHSLGDLAGVKGLGLTGQKRALETYLNAKTGRTKQIKSKYLEKGLINEDLSITLANNVLGLNLVKNEERKFNDYIMGICDCIDNDFVIDIKSSWDYFTFYESTLALNTDYEWQLRAYMELWDKPKAKLIYCLTDTPKYLIENALKRMMDENGSIENVYKAYQTISNMVYTKDAFYDLLESQMVFTRDIEIEKSFIEIPEKDRVFVFEIERDKNKIDFIYNRVNDARNYLKTVFNES